MPENGYPAGYRREGKMGMGSYLTLDHRVVERASEIKYPADLANHLTQDHHIEVPNRHLYMLGKLHLLAHACEAFPELLELMGVSPEEWTKKRLRVELVKDGE